MGKMSKLTTLKFLFLILMLMILFSLITESTGRRNPSSEVTTNSNVNKYTTEKNELVGKEITTVSKIEAKENNYLFVSTLEGNIHAYSSIGGKELWKVSLGKPLIVSNINSKNILYDKNAVIPGLDGNIYYYDRNDEEEKEGFIDNTDQTNINLQNLDNENYLSEGENTSSGSYLRKVDVPLKTLIDNSPFTFPNLPDYIFIGDKKTSMLTIDIDKGVVLSRGEDDVRRRPIQSDNLLNIIRVDYTLQCLNQITGTQSWNVTVSEVMAIQKGVRAEIALTNSAGQEMALQSANLQQLIQNNPQLSSAVSIHSYSGRDKTPIKIYDVKPKDTFPDQNFVEFINEQNESMTNNINPDLNNINIFQDYLDWRKRNKNTKNKDDDKDDTSNYPNKFAHKSLIHFLVFKFWEMYYFEDFFFVYLSVIFFLVLLVIFLLTVIFKYMKRNDQLIQKVNEIRKISGEAFDNLDNISECLSYKKSYSLEKLVENTIKENDKRNNDLIVEEVDKFQENKFEEKVIDNLNDSEKNKINGNNTTNTLQTNFETNESHKKSDNTNPIINTNQDESSKITNSNKLFSDESNLSKIMRKENSSTALATYIDPSIKPWMTSPNTALQSNNFDLMKNKFVDLGLKEHQKEVVSKTDLKVYKSGEEYVQEEVHTVITKFSNDQKVENTIKQFQNQINEMTKKLKENKKQVDDSFERVEGTNDNDKNYNENKYKSKDEKIEKENYPVVQVSWLVQQKENEIKFVFEGDKKQTNRNKKEEDFSLTNSEDEDLDLPKKENTNKNYINYENESNMPSCTSIQKYKKRKYNTKDYSIINNEKINKTHIDEGRLQKTFEEIEKIGQGGFGCVFKARHKIDGSDYAIKMIRLKVGHSHNLMEHKVIKEVKTMMKLNHKNVVRYTTCWFQLKIDTLNNLVDSMMSVDNFTNTLDNCSRLALTKKESNLKETPYKDFTYRENTLNQISEEMQSEEGKAFNWDITETKENESIVFQADNKKETITTNQNDKALSISIEKCDSLSDESLEKYSRHNAYDDNQHFGKNKKDNNAFYIVYFFMQMEYCDGLPLNLFLEKGLDRKTVYSFFKQILSGVNHIHKNNVIHRDLKPHNIFIFGKDSLKIGDFGLATELREKSFNNYNTNNNYNISLQHSITHDSVKLSKYVGTPLYLSPEQNEGLHYNQKVDIYAMGLILFEMVSSFKTFMERNINMEKLKNEQTINETISSKFEYESDLILWMTKKKASDRPTAQEIVDSEIMKKWKNSLN